MAEYKPLFMYLEPASIPQVVAHIQKYLAENPIISDEETIAELIREYIAAHPEIIAVASVNGKVGAVVLTGSDIMINPSSAVSVETQLLNLASMINNTGADITQIQENISQIYTTIGTLQTNVETNASNISALQTSVEGQGTRLATAESDIDSLESAQSAQNTRLNTAEGEIASLDMKIGTAETNINNNENNIETLNTNLSSINERTGTIENYINTSTEQYTLSASDIDNFDISGEIVLKRQNNIVSISFTSVGTITTSGTGWVTLFHVPNRFIPSIRQKMVGILDPDFDVIESQMTANGEFQVYAPTNNTKFWGGALFYMLL